MTNISSVQIGFKGKLLLGEPFIYPQFLNSRAKLLRNCHVKSRQYPRLNVYSLLVTFFLIVGRECSLVVTTLYEIESREEAMRNSLLITVALAVILVGCTQTPKIAAIVKPATVIRTASLERVISKLAELCDRNSLRIDNTDAHSISCSQEAPMMAQVLLGTRYGTTVRSKVKFTAFKVASGVRVTGYQWLENQTAYGQNKTTDLSSSPDANRTVQVMLDEARREIEGRRK